jgi:LacI family transcriptional regulator
MKELAEELKLTLKVVDGDFSELKARELTFKFAKRNDMVICASDLMAIGAMKALIEMDIFRPVCGFDGLTLMGYVGKQMNTIRQDFSGISQEAVKELARLMDGGEGRNVIMPHEIVRLRYEDIIR